MNADALSQVLSSRIRLKIEDAVSTRPRTLGELASITGISVQGVLRHLKLLESLGLVEERPLRPRTPKARTVYVAKSVLMGDYSTPGLTVVKSTEMTPVAISQRKGAPNLEMIAGELLIRKRRIRDETRRLGRMIDEYVGEKGALVATLDKMKLDSRQRLILTVLLTEEIREDGMKVLASYYGVKDIRTDLGRYSAGSNRK